MTLVEYARLLGIRFRRQGHNHRVAQRIELCAQAGNEVGIGLCQRCAEKFKVHIQCPVPFVLHIGDDLCDQQLLPRGVGQDVGRPLGAEISLLRQGGKVHPRLYFVSCRVRQQRLVG